MSTTRLLPLGLFSLLTFFPSLTMAVVRDTKNLSVPFTLQAPQSKWVQPWADGCEEATIVMLNHYYQGDAASKIPVTTAMAEMNQWFSLENKLFKQNKDTNADQTMRLINEFTPWEAYKVFRPTLAAIKAEIDNKRPVIALVHGKALKNPNFRNGGPDYHMLVIRGYDDQRNEFIVNDPGFGKGLDFRYQYGKLLASLHDFVPGGKTITGTPLVLFTQPNSTDSNSTDGDQDGLTKADEIRLGTSLFAKDTDESALGIGSLVRSAADPTVYFIGVGEKHPIANPQVMVNHGWEMSQVKIVSQSFLDMFATRPVVTE